MDIETLKIHLQSLDQVELDCGDHSCIFAKQKTGVRTNGGCRCWYSNSAKTWMQRAKRVIDEIRKI
jgi:hypothetical protein